MKTWHFFVVSVAAMLGGCQVCTDCEPVDYVLDSSDVSYIDEGAVNFTSDVVTEGEVWTETSAPTLDYIPNYTVSTSYYYPAATTRTQPFRPWRNSYRQLPYSGPPFTTPPMQPIPYPTENYYPFKRPSPGVHTPQTNRMRPRYYPKYSAPTYRPVPYYFY